MQCTSSLKTSISNAMMKSWGFVNKMTLRSDYITKLNNRGAQAAAEKCYGNLSLTKSICCEVLNAFTSLQTYILGINVGYRTWTMVVYTKYSNTNASLSVGKWPLFLYFPREAFLSTSNSDSVFYFDLFGILQIY